jgi:hypothetical protein
MPGLDGLEVRRRIPARIDFHPNGLTKLIIYGALWAYLDDDYIKESADRLLNEIGLYRRAARGRQ